MLIVDRYEIGERQTSACAAPTEWLTAIGAGGLDPADVLGLWWSTPPHAVRLPSDLLHLRLPELCAPLYDQYDAEFETATVEGRRRGADGGSMPSRPTAARFAPRWSSTRSAGGGFSGQTAPAA